MPNPVLSSINNVLLLKDLSPSPIVNQTMSALVQSVIDYPEAQLPSEAVLEEIRQRCSTSESALETYWSKRIANSKDPAHELRGFPYHHNYRELVRRELKIVTDSGLVLNSASRILVIGSGSLPLTAYEIIAQTNATVDQIDSLMQAVAAGRRFNSALQIQSEYQAGFGESIQLDHQYDMVLIAALAGNTQSEKQAIIDNILPHITAHGRVLIRSATGTRAVLYTVLNPTHFKGVTLLHEYHPNDAIINSVLLYGVST